MVRENTLSNTFSIDLSSLCSITWGDPSFQVKVYLDTDASDIKVTEWKEEGSQEKMSIAAVNKDKEVQVISQEKPKFCVGKSYVRYIFFETPVRAPSIITSYFGSVICTRVKEHFYFEDANTFHIKDTMDLRGTPFTSETDGAEGDGSLLSSISVSVSTTCTREDADSTTLSTKTRCELKKGIFGLTGMIEGAIEKDLLSSLRKWQRLVDQLVQTWKAEQEKQPKAKAEETVVAPQSQEPSKAEVLEPVQLVEEKAESLIYVEEQTESVKSDEETLSVKSTTTTTTTTTYHDVLSEPEQQEPKERKKRLQFETSVAAASSPFEPPLPSMTNVPPHERLPTVSGLISRSYELAGVKRQISDMHTVLTRTDMRIRSLEHQLQDRHLEQTVESYLKRINELYALQQTKHEKLNEQKQQLEKLVETLHSPPQAALMQARTPS